MSRRAGLALLSVAALLAVGLVVWTTIGAGEAERGRGDEVAPAVVPADPPSEEGWTVELYFPAGDSLLHPESRELPDPGGSIEARATALVAAVLEGPRRDGLVAPLPDGTELVGIFVGSNGVVYVDLRSSAEGETPPAGSRRELLSLYSLVDSVLLNLPDADRMALLRDGRQPLTFAGHLDTTRPLEPRRDLIVRRGS